MFPYRDDNPPILTPFVTVVDHRGQHRGLGAGAGDGSRSAAWLRSVCELGLVPGDLLHRLPVGTTIPIGGRDFLRGRRAARRGGRCSPRCSCTAAGCTCWATCGSSGCSATTSRTSMGHGRFLAFYLCAGSRRRPHRSLADPASAVPMVGASGAISGVMGAYVVLYPRSRVHILVFVIFIFRTSVPAWVMLGYWFFLQLLGAGMEQGVGGVAVWAHIGGFLAGAVLIALFRSPDFAGPTRSDSLAAGPGKDVPHDDTELPTGAHHPAGALVRRPRGDTARRHDPAQSGHAARSGLGARGARQSQRRRAARRDDRRPAARSRRRGRRAGCCAPSR